MRATKMIKELVNKTSEKRLREQGLLGLEERGLRGSITVYKYAKGCYGEDIDQLFSLENKDRTGIRQRNKFTEKIADSPLPEKYVAEIRDSSYERIKTFLVKKQTLRKRSQKSDRAVNLIAIAIISQMSNNKESIIQRMISEVLRGCGDGGRADWGQSATYRGIEPRPSPRGCAEPGIRLLQNHRMHLKGRFHLQKSPYLAKCQMGKKEISPRH
ncbi:hypothetical protein QYF61_008525 [Mycteria americana]|uniref:Uncharacterized protein n=1 Tax=Mycteria americana TaxID=33587 RepID=A0AAN7NMF8_MYCAM|nr:hypothetical protein QYF61_008525 [Mycteria americana]